MYRRARRRIRPRKSRRGHGRSRDHRTGIRGTVTCQHDPTALGHQNPYLVHDSRLSGLAIRGNRDTLEAVGARVAATVLLEESA